MKKDRKMRIMFDSQIFRIQSYGGVSRYHVELMKELAKENIIYLPICGNVNVYLEESKNIKKIKSNNKYLNKIYSLFSFILELFYSKKSNIVHLTWTNPRLNKHAKNKMVITIHDMIHEIYWHELPEFKKEIENKRKAIFDSSKIIAISENTKRDILKIYPEIPENKITVVYHGTNHLPAPIMPKFSIPKKYFLFVGGRTEYKGADFLLDAFSKLHNEFSNVYLLFAGGGEFSYEEINKIETLKIKEFVSQANVSDAELAYLYSNAICFIYPSHYEGFGLPILEAFDNSCPTLCTNASCLPEIGGTAAAYFQENNMEQLIAGMKKMLTNENFREMCINRGRDRVKNFTWEKCARETLDVYKSIDKINKK